MVKHGYATEEQVRAVAQRLTPGTSLGELLKSEGVLNTNTFQTLQREVALTRFLQAEQQFAKLCVEQGRLTMQEARELLLSQRQANYSWRISDRLVQDGRIQESERDALT